MGYYENELRSGQWTWDTKTKGLLNRSVGLISYGAISSRVIPKLRLFTDDIRVYSTHKNAEIAQKEGFKYAELDEIFAECDVVSVHTAKNPQTIHMIGKKQFELLKDGALFINTSRGAVIKELELIEALKNKNFICRCGTGAVICSAAVRKSLDFENCSGTYRGNRVI